MRKLLFVIFNAGMVFHAVAQTNSDTAYHKQELQEQVVSGIVAGKQMPVTHITIKAKQIAEKYYGADIPTFLNATPSVNAYSDNGTGIGYSYFRLRGLDQSRINTTLNGIPVNDQEGQGTYFNNFADLLSSVSSIQLQRGVGTSTNGTASIGGSLNIVTRELSSKSSCVINSGFGSFNSRRLSAEYQTGLLANHFAFYGRIGDLSTDGYRDRSGVHIRSMLLSGGYFMKKSVLKFNILSGYSESQLSYTGIDQRTLSSAPKANPFVNNESDAFKQNFYQVEYATKLGTYSSLSASAYYVYGNAPKFQYFLDGSYNSFSYMNMPDVIIGSDTFQYTDAIGSYRLNQNFYGLFATYNYNKGPIDLKAGVHANSFSSEHFMEVNWARMLPGGILQNHRAYDNTGYKNEMNAFVKLTYSINADLSLFADIQARNAQFKYRGKDGVYHRDTFSVEDMSWIFINPKVGFRYSLNKQWSVYGMVGMTSREPTRSDYFLDEYPHQNIKQSDLKPEQVTDIELGSNLRNEKWVLNANLFLMNFNNQLVNTGQLNAVGTPITTNVSSSYRYGLELDFVWKISSKLWLTNSTMFMQNSIKSLTQYYDSAGAYITSVGVTFKNTPAALSPNFIINQGVRYIPINWFYAELNGRMVAKQYLDNTKDENLTIKSYTLADVKTVIQLSKWIKVGEPQLTLQCNNLLDTKYTPSGNTTGNIMDYTSGNAIKSSTALYFPAATRNYMVTLTWRF